MCSEVVLITSLLFSVLLSRPLPLADKTSVDMTEVAFEDIAKKQEGEVEIKWQMLD